MKPTKNHIKKGGEHLHLPNGRFQICFFHSDVVRHLPSVFLPYKSSRCQLLPKWNSKGLQPTCFEHEKETKTPYSTFVWVGDTEKFLFCILLRVICNISKQTHSQRRKSLGLDDARILGCILKRYVFTLNHVKIQFSNYDQTRNNCTSLETNQIPYYSSCKVE